MATSGLTCAPWVGARPFLVLQLALRLEMVAAGAGDRPGKLYIMQPKQGLPGLAPSQLLEVREGGVRTFQKWLCSMEVHVAGRVC